MKTLLKTDSTQLCVDLLSLLKKMKSNMAIIAEGHGLTPIQLGALHAINEGFTTMGKIAQTMHCDASNVTGIIDRLTILDLVNRHEDPRDRRVKTVQLTAKGKAVLQEVIELLPSRLGCTMLSGNERQTLHDIIIKMTHA